ncbi:MAG: hypothetical protein GX975_02100 [Clostridiales bacterium]|nr:hypothetical protein [Clostridiales bacterium]
MKIGNSTIIGINTVFLYLFAVAILGFVAFLMLRNFLRKHKFSQQEGGGEFEEMSRTDKQLGLKLLLENDSQLQGMFTWLSAGLMKNLKAKQLEVSLLQEWCEEDLSGKADAPIRTRPEKLIFKVDGEESVYELNSEELRALSVDEIKVLNWGIMERCKTLIPFRRYKMLVNRTTRNFKVENEVSVNWKTDVVVKEDYTVKIE